MEKPLLNDQDVFPTSEVLAALLGKSYAVFEELMAIFTGTEFGFIAEWRYYRDGKAWLCKVCYKKKTVFWLSIWDGFFMTSFHIAERHKDGFLALSIDAKLKNEFAQCQACGNLLTLPIKVSKKKQIKDVLQLARHKIALK